MVIVEIVVVAINRMIVILVRAVEQWPRCEDKGMMEQAEGGGGSGA